MYDAVVIGARCGGAATAMLLARKGHRVLLVDRATFPSDIPHGHFIHRSGPTRLAKWGLLDRVLATGCPAITSFTSDFGDFPLVGNDLSVDRVTGIRGGDRRAGTSVTEHARITIGADGRNSHVARAVSAPEYEAVPSLTCWYFSYWADVPGESVEVYDRHGRVCFAFPTSDKLIAVFIAWPISELAMVRADIERQFLAAVDSLPALAERVRAGRRADRFYGATDLRNFFRKPYGPGWALVGDAGAHKDPYLALGICDAFRDAELISD